MPPNKAEKNEQFKEMKDQHVKRFQGLSEQVKTTIADYKATPTGSSMGEKVKNQEVTRSLMQMQQHAEAFKTAFKTFQESETSFEGVVTGAYFEEESKVRRYSDPDMSAAQTQQQKQMTELEAAQKRAMHAGLQQRLEMQEERREAMLRNNEIMGEL